MTTPLTPGQLATVLAGKLESPIKVTLPESGQMVQVMSILTREVRASEAIPRAGTCWAPNKIAIEDPDGSTWPEFAVVRRLRRAGWDGRWIKNWTGGREFCVDVDRPAAFPTDAAKTFVKIHEQAYALRGAGSWDVMAWRGTDYLFVELKQHRSSDRLNPNQLAWLEAALAVGVPAASFAVVSYDPGSPERGHTRSKAPAPHPEPMTTEFRGLLTTVKAMDPGTRIESRDEVAGYGTAAIGSMVEWLDDDDLRRFAIGVLEVIGRTDRSAEIALAKHVRASGPDHDLAAAALNRLRPVGGGRPRARSVAPTFEYVASGMPPPAQGRCGVITADGHSCQNPGRWPIGDVYACTTHYKAHTRRTGSY
jgi:hypothetical protein